MHPNSYKAIIIGCFILELALMTFCKACLGHLLSPLILFISSTGIGVTSLLLAFQKGNSQRVNYNLGGIWSWDKAFFMLLTVLMTLLIAIKFNIVFNNSPLDQYDVSNSDVIPQIMFLVDRWLNGEFPYQLIEAWGYEMQPTYLPLQWMPYAIAELFKMDYRWIAFLSMALAMGILSYKIIRTEYRNGVKAFILIVPFIAWYALVESDEFSFGYTVEQLMAAYYLLLGLALLSQNSTYISLALVLCLLSRYSVVLWVPLLFIFIYLRDHIKIWKILIILLTGFLVIYVPFLAQDPEIFNKGYAYHTNAAIGEWSRSAQPVHLFDGVGLAVYFFEFVKGSIEQKISVLQWTHLILVVGVVISLSWAYIKKRAVIHQNLFLLASLKIYLAVFYNFIQIPYWYLFIVPFVISFLCIYESFRYRGLMKQPTSI
jgi:hypothetical protein